MIGVGIALALLFALLTLVSYVDRLYQEIGKFLSREFQDNIDAFEQIVEPRLGVTRERASLSMAILTQLVTAAIAMIVGFTVFRDRAWSVYEVLEATLSLVLIVIVFSRLLPFVYTVEKIVELLRAKPFSRIPVYEGSIHHIKGILHTQDVLQVPDSEAHTRTVASLMRKDVYFVPESKLVSDLLREMQRSNIRMAIVVDEYGGVAGLVTIEDLVEEIVGEIGDEHEKAQVVQENDHSYIVPGNMDVDRLDELFGMRPEGHESSTIAG